MKERRAQFGVETKQTMNKACVGFRVYNRNQTRRVDAAHVIATRGVRFFVCRDKRDRQTKFILVMFLQCAIAWMCQSPNPFIFRSS